MTRNQMDAVVAAKIGCTASYVQQVRLHPEKFKSEKARQIRKLLTEMEQKRQAFMHDILQPA